MFLTMSVTVTLPHYSNFKKNTIGKHYLFENESVKTRFKATIDKCEQYDSVLDKELEYLYCKCKWCTSCRFKVVVP